MWKVDQGIASKKVPFKLVDASDNPVTNAAAIAVTYGIDGGATTAISNPTFAAASDQVNQAGIYWLTLPTAVFATLGAVSVTVTSSGCKTVEMLFDVVSPAPTVAAVAAAILATPENKLAVNASGQVTASNPGGDATAANQAVLAIAIGAIPTNPMPAGAEVVLAAAQTSYAPAKAGDAMTLASAERTAILDALWSRAVWGTVTFKRWARLLASMAAGRRLGGSASAGPRSWGSLVGAGDPVLTHPVTDAYGNTSGPATIDTVALDADA